MIRRLAPALLLASAALACGGFGSPDLEHGAVTGRILDARPGAYAYVLGAPHVIALASSDGSFRLDRVPRGQPRIVLYDGASGAESLAVTVSGAAISELNPGRPLKAAGAVVVGASPLSGLLPTGLTFVVEGTPVTVSGESGAAQLFPLPAGTFSVVALQPGFRELRREVAVGEGSSGSFEVELEVEEDDDRRGCLSCGCEDGLACNPADGRCYQCVTNADCGANGTCTASRVCSYPGGSGQACEACSVSTDCAGAGASCANPTGGFFTGYCSRSCTSSQGCPSGQDCEGGICTVELTCLAFGATYGATCVQDETCKSALHDGKCLPADRPSRTPGHCGARVQAGCPAGFRPDERGDYCVRG